MSVEISVNKAQAADYAAKTTKAAVAGAAIAGSFQVGKNLAPLAKDCFNASINKQNAAIEAFKKTGKTVAEYVGLEKKRIALFDTPATIIKTARSLTEEISSGGKPIIAYKDASKGKNFEELLTNIAQKGQKGALKDLAKTEKIITKGEASKLEAAKDTVIDLLKDKGALLKENKTAILKKAGKAALIGAAIAGTTAIVAKAILNSKAEKTNEAE